MTKQAWIARWRNYTAGVIALGAADAKRIVSTSFEGPQQLGKLMMDLGTTTDALLGTLYEDLMKQMKNDVKT